MGITLNSSALLLSQKENGVDFRNIALIGRQQFFSCNPQEYKRMLNENGWEDSSYDLDVPGLMGDGVYADAWLSRLVKNGKVVSFDASDYEGATYVHDFNTPIKEKYRSQFSLVLDGGSSEHIFNLPVVFSNYMKMIKMNGHYIGILPCNQWGGHGFYQFSPEFFYRVFSLENGFADTKVFIYFERGDAKVQLFPDPKTEGHRIEFKSSQPLTCFIVSKKIDEIEPFSAWPQQSDYEHKAWKG